MTASIRAVVVDDERAGREAVATLLADVEDVAVVAEAGTGAEAIRVVRELRPDLLFLDVQMPDVDGFAVLESLGDDVPRGVVLVTAHGEYAQRAFDVHAVDYVMKPFGRPRFIAAVERALRRLRAEEALDLRATMDSLVRSLRSTDEDGASASAPVVSPEPGEVGASPRRIGVRLGTRTTLVDVDDVDWAEADGDLVRLHAAGKVHLLRSSLRSLEATLGDGFFRTHRSIVVRLDRIAELHREPDGSGRVALADGVLVRVARARWEALEAALGLRSNPPG